ncbi:MAG: BT4734/BF3469 family protein [Bacteroidota bacterium]
MYHLLKGNQFAQCTSTLRSITDKQEARKYKASVFDYVTFSGTFSKRNDKSLLRHSGLITIDFDHIGNVPEWKDRLLKDEYFETELLFASRACFADSGRPVQTACMLPNLRANRP